MPASHQYTCEQLPALTCQPPAPGRTDHVVRDAGGSLVAIITHPAQRAPWHVHTWASGMLPYVNGHRSGASFPSKTAAMAFLVGLAAAREVARRTSSSSHARADIHDKVAAFLAPVLAPAAVDTVRAVVQLGTDTSYQAGWDAALSARDVEDADADVLDPRS